MQFYEKLFWSHKIRDAVRKPGPSNNDVKDALIQSSITLTAPACLELPLPLPEMQLICDAVIYKIYRFECGYAKEAKVNEVLIWSFNGQTMYQWLTPFLLHPHCSRGLLDHAPRTS